MQPQYIFLRLYLFDRRKCYATGAIFKVEVKSKVSRDEGQWDSNTGKYYESKAIVEWISFVGISRCVVGRVHV